MFLARKEKQMKLGKVKATVFEAKKEENRKNTVTANISTYEGKDQDGNNQYCSWRARFVRTRTGLLYQKARLKTTIIKTRKGFMCW